MRRSVLVVLAVLTSLSVNAQQHTVTSGAGDRRVSVTLTFSGQELFLHGQTPPGTRSVVAVMEGPGAGGVRLMEKGRVALFWMGVRQYRLIGVPGLYLVDASCPECNGMRACPHGSEVEAANKLFAPLGFVVGKDDISARAELEGLSGALAAGEVARIVDGYWTLQADRGLYGVHQNTIRINPEGKFYHRLTLPTEAPEGRYSVTTYFLAADRLVATETSELFVRKSGLVAWLSRLAERRAFLYGILCVGIAIAAGWLAGTLFKRGGGH